MRRVREVAIAALLLLLPGAASIANDAAPERFLTGQLLIASPSIGDPRFKETVILMVKHDRDGAFGIILNRPVSERPLAGLLEAMGEPDPDATGSVRLHAGGPVEPQVGFVIHSTDYRQPDTIEIDGRVAMTVSREVLRDIARGQGPAKALIAFGYAGWGPGQLERELKGSGWFTMPEEPRLVFDAPRETVWREAMARRSRDL